MNNKKENSFNHCRVEELAHRFDSSPGEAVVHVYSQHVSWAHLETERKGPAKVQEAGVSRVRHRDLVSISTPGICTMRS